MQPSIPSAAIRASLSAISRVWKATGPEFFLEEIDDSTILASGDFLITVVFHLKETSEDTPLFEAIVRAEESKRLQEEADVAKKESSSSSLPARITLDDALSLIAPANDDDVDAVDEEEEEEEDATRPPPPQHRPVVPPQLCVSFVVSVVGQQSGGGNELLVFENDELPGSKKAPRSVCFELFGNGSNGDTFAWSFINEDDFEKDASPLQSLKIVAATSFRHRFVDLDTKKWVYDRKEVVERSWILTSIDMPFPHELIELNLDYLANFLLLGILIPETLHNDLADCVETRGLCRRAMLLERYEAEGKLKPLKLTKAKVETIISTASKLHHLAHVGHIGIIVESSLIVGGAAYDAVYDPQNLARNAKKRGKLATAATAGGIIGGVVGVLIPIPGLFLALSVAGSYAGRWIAGKFITDDGTELPDVVPVGGLRSENDEVTEVIQDFDEDAPVWKKTWNRLTQAKKQNSQKALPAPPTSALLLIEQPQVRTRRWRKCNNSHFFFRLNNQKRKLSLFLLEHLHQEKSRKMERLCHGRTRKCGLRRYKKKEE